MPALGQWPALERASQAIPKALSKISATIFPEEDSENLRQPC
jgi:hypothetical protein